MDQAVFRATSHRRIISAVLFAMLIVVLVAAEGHAKAVADTAVVRMDLAKVEGAIRLHGLATPLRETIVFARAKTLKQALKQPFR